MIDAALGVDLDVDNLVGNPVRVTVPAGTQPNEMIIFAEEGMPRLRSEGHGDLIGHVNVEVPRELDETARDLLERVRDHRKDGASVHREGDEGSGLFSKLKNKFRK